MFAARTLGLPLALTLGLCAGCLGPRRDDYLSAQRVSLSDDSIQEDALWEAILETLRRGRFQLDRVDRRAGLVTTLPETSQQFFEFWRHDVDTREDLWESTLNPVRRRVHVNLARARGDSSAELSVAVYKERQSSPDRQFNSTGAAYVFFGERLPSTTGAARVTADDDRWLEMGRDPAMEEYLLRAMLDRAGVAAHDGPTE